MRFATTSHCAHPTALRTWKTSESIDCVEDFRRSGCVQLHHDPVGYTVTNYESLYAQALGDPKLKRTRLELEAAVSNANEARQVVFGTGKGVRNQFARTRTGSVRQSV